MDDDPLKPYWADGPPTIVPLTIQPHFDALSAREKLYAHHLSKASFAGTRIVLRQVSPEAEAIFDFILALHAHRGGDWAAVQRDAGIPDAELAAFLDYAAQFLGNLGNYKSFGDSKFVPRAQAATLEALARLSPRTQELYARFRASIFGDTSNHAKAMLLGYPDQGHVSTYYPDGQTTTKDEITAVGDFLAAKGLLPENTRLRKTEQGFEALVASAVAEPSEAERDVKDGTEWTLADGELAGKTVKLVFGDHGTEMKTIAECIAEAKKHAANETEARMLDAYAQSFRTGSLEAFKESQRLWIQDKGPQVETDIGFIETYRDPHGIRGEWEGFVAMVNKDRTRAFARLVQAAPTLIPMLPWDREFEKDKFLSPDFTSLEVLTFAGSGIPAGINIPNYDDIRQNLGFKNVSLGNVLSASSPNEPIPFIPAPVQALYRANRDIAFEIQVGLHELLGHGCGKLLQETSPGVFNFDTAQPPVSPLTGQPVTTHYKPGQTWSSVFGAVAASYEECRAECVAMVLACEPAVLALFGFGPGDALDLAGPQGDVLHAAYLSMARAGLAGLEFWDPRTRKWGQAHMQARFSILRVLLEAGPDVCALHYTYALPPSPGAADSTTTTTTTTTEEKLDPAAELVDIAIEVQRAALPTRARRAMEQYLRALHVHKSTADVDAGKALYGRTTDVSPWFAAKVRPLVVQRRVPRKVFVMANTVVEPRADGAGDDAVVLREYESSAKGMVASWADRSYV